MNPITLIEEILALMNGALPLTEDVLNLIKAISVLFPAAGSTTPASSAVVQTLAAHLLKTSAAKSA